MPWPMATAMMSQQGGGRGGYYPSISQQHRDVTADEYQDLRRPRKIRFFCNGDRYFKGKKLFITPNRYCNLNDLQNELTRTIPVNAHLPYGVRQIYSPNTQRKVNNIEDLQDGKSYVCAGFEAFKVMPYGKRELPSWYSGRRPNQNNPLDYGRPSHLNNAFHPGKHLRQSYPLQSKPAGSLAGGTRSSISYATEPVAASKPKLITVVRNGEEKPRNNVKILLNRRACQSFEQLVSQIVEAFGPKFKHDKIRHLYTVRGKPVTSISDFFREDNMFIGFGKEIERVGGKQGLQIPMKDVQEIISELHPDNPYAESYIKDWERNRKRSRPSQYYYTVKEDTKRDSGFGDSDSSKGDDILIYKAQNPHTVKKTTKEQKLAAKLDATRQQVLNEERERATQRLNKRLETERRIREEERRKRGLVTLKPINDPFRKMDEEKKKERLQNEAERRRVEEEYDDEVENEAEEEEEEEEKENNREGEEVEEEDFEKKREEEERLKEIKKAGDRKRREEEERAKKEKEREAIKEKIKEKEMERLKAKEKDKEKQKEKEKNSNNKENDDLDTNANKKSKKKNKLVSKKTKLERQISRVEHVYSRYEAGKTLGDGNFAIVKQCKMRNTESEYAMKIIDKAKLKGKEHMIENEIEIMRSCNHHNIIRLLDEYETKDEIFLIMELVKGGDLFDAITQSVKFSEPNAAEMTKDLCEALFYLHSRHVVHRDLKPENLMVLRNKRGGITLKLADFGLAMEVKEPIFTVCGTPTYVAPEILAETGYGLEVDMWAVGVITYILLCGFPPFRSPDRNQTELFEYIKAGEFEFLSPYWDKTSQSAKDLIGRLLVVDRRKRFTAIEVLCHPWTISSGGALSVPEKIDEYRHNLRKELETTANKALVSWQKRHN